MAGCASGQNERSVKPSPHRVSQVRILDLPPSPRGAGDSTSASEAEGRPFESGRGCHGAVLAGAGDGLQSHRWPVRPRPASLIGLWPRWIGRPPKGKVGGSSPPKPAWVFTLWQGSGFGPFPRTLAGAGPSELVRQYSWQAAADREGRV